MRKVLLLIAALTVILAGCRVESNVILDIDEDGSALVGAEVGYDEEFRQLLEQSGASTDDLFGDLPTFGDDVVATERTEGDMTFVGVASQVPNLSTFAEDSAELGTFSSFSYQFDDDGATLAATVSAADADVGDFGELGFDPGQLTEDFFSANVVVTMPGEVTEHNADVVRSDGTLVWKIPLSGSKQINATSTFGSSTTNLLLILLIGLLLIGIIVVIVATVLSRRQSQQAVAVAAASSSESADASAGTEVPDAASATEAEQPSSAPAAPTVAEAAPVDAPHDAGDSAGTSPGTEPSTIDEETPGGEDSDTGDDGAQPAST